MWTPDPSIIITAEMKAAEARLAFVGSVKAECRRRILLIMTEDEQRNTLAAGQAATMQHGADPTGWPPELRDRQAAAMVAWGEIERLRARSNEIEAVEPIPAEVDLDALWENGAG